MRESEIQRAVIEHWRALATPGTLVAAIPNQRAHGQYGLTPGLPDLMCLGQFGVGFIELKTARGKASQAQLAFRELCAQHGIRHALTYGRDEPIDVLELWGLVRKSNRRPGIGR